MKNIPVKPGFVNKKGYAGRMIKREEMPIYEEKNCAIIKEKAKRKAVFLWQILRLLWKKTES